MRHAVLLALGLTVGAQHSSSPAPTRVDYTLRVDSTDLQNVSVEMRIHGAPSDFRVAMSTHPEYDDQYWRYITSLTAASAQTATRVTREDSAVWHVIGASGDVVLRYRVRYPTATVDQQASWKAHLTSSGGLIGGPHSFLYVVGGERAPVHATLVLPFGWDVATGLERGANAGEYIAPDAEGLIDSPMLVGKIRHWPFLVDGVPHDIAYLGQPGGVAFDSALFVSNVERITRETVRMFGWMPYRRYQFLFEGGALAGLEHLNSVSIGIRTADLARDPNWPLAQLAHEFFHTWNEVHLRPLSWIGLRHVSPEPTGELWWAEGVTLYYADLLLRRAGLHAMDSTREAHLVRLLTAYNGNPSHGLVSPEQTSKGFNLPPGVNGDFTPSMYTQGEAIGFMLDVMVRSESKGAHSLDDVMRDLARHFTPEHGYGGADIERAVAAACGCETHPFFDRHVRAANPIDFDQALAMFGWRAAMQSEPARDAQGLASPDTRVSGFLRVGERAPRIQVWFPSTVWARAGLHTGDQVVTWNNASMSDALQLRSAISQLRVGDTVRLAVQRDAEPFNVIAVVTGYDRPVVRIEEWPDATPAQRALRSAWGSGR